MMKVLVVVPAVLLAVALSACDSEANAPASIPSGGQDLWPIIKSITATPAGPPAPGATIQVAVDAKDPNHLPMTYAWSDDCGGTFGDATSPTTTWTAPAAPASCNLSVLVNETDGNTYDWRYNLSSLPLNVTVPPPAAVYDSIPAEIPPSLVSQSFEATQTSEFGDQVTMAGTARLADSATFVMVTWDLNAYTYPITLNLYHPDDLTHPFATRTQSFAIPARPPADPSCSDGRWLAPDGCHYGFAFPVTFDLTGVTLPDSFVYGISFDTQSYGPQPMGAAGYYNNLNVGLVTDPPSVGSRAGGTVYENSSWTGAYHTGTPGNFGVDTGWTSYAPARFVAHLM
jgi:hypothetical protein